MIERHGIPAALLTAMTAMARVAGAHRILASGLIPHPVGDPTRPAEDEALWRTGQVHRALRAVATPLAESQIFPNW